MSEDLNAWGLLRKLTWEHVLLVLAVLLAARLLSFVVRWVLRRTAENASPHLRLSILRAMPITRLLIGVAAVVITVPILVEPTFRNVVTLGATVGLALAFALKDYASSLVAGLATVLENTYQPGDWIEVGGSTVRSSPSPSEPCVSSHPTIPRSSFRIRCSGRPASPTPAAAVEACCAWRSSTCIPTMMP